MRFDIGFSPINEDANNNKAALRHLLLFGISHSIFLASAYEGGQLPCRLIFPVSVFIAAELARRRKWSRNLRENLCLGGFEPQNVLLETTAC